MSFRLIIKFHKYLTSRNKLQGDRNIGNALINTVIPEAVRSKMANSNSMRVFAPPRACSLAAFKVIRLIVSEKMFRSNTF